MRIGKIKIFERPETSGEIQARTLQTLKLQSPVVSETQGGAAMTPCANCRMVHAQGPCPVISETPALCPHGVDRTLYGCDFCVSVSETPAHARAGEAETPTPAGIEQSWVEILETYYDFQCEGGPLRNCAEWHLLKAKVTALRQQLREAEAEHGRLQDEAIKACNLAAEWQAQVATLTQEKKHLLELTAYDSDWAARAEAAESRLALLTAGVQTVLDELRELSAAVDDGDNVFTIADEIAIIAEHLHAFMEPPK